MPFTPILKSSEQDRHRAHARRSGRNRADAADSRHGAKRRSVGSIRASWSSTKDERRPRRNRSPVARNPSTRTGKISRRSQTILARRFDERRFQVHTQPLAQAWCFRFWSESSILPWSRFLPNWRRSRAMKKIIGTTKSPAGWERWCSGPSRSGRAGCRVSRAQPGAD